MVSGKFPPAKRPTKHGVRLTIQEPPDGKELIGARRKYDIPMIRGLEEHLARPAREPEIRVCGFGTDRMRNSTHALRGGCQRRLRRSSPEPWHRRRRGGSAFAARYASTDPISNNGLPELPGSVGRRDYDNAGKDGPATGGLPPAAGLGPAVAC